ncbi:MAG TPA: hypothetical protein VH701_05685 [Vicinamibacterales bacterium]|jgi:predicted nucleic acid-binding protein
MTTYADSSALIPLYVNERFSGSAESVLRHAGQIPFSAVHQLEVPNAFERLVGRNLMTRDEPTISELWVQFHQGYRAALCTRSGVSTGR